MKCALKASLSFAVSVCLSVFPSVSLSLFLCLSVYLSVCLSVSPYICLSVSLTHWSWGSLWTRYRGCQIDSITLDAFLDRTSLNQLRDRDRENTFIFFYKNITIYTIKNTYVCLYLSPQKRHWILCLRCRGIQMSLEGNFHLSKQEKEAFDHKS